MIKVGAKDATEVSLAFKVNEVTDGRQGGAFHYTGQGKAMLAVLHPEHAEGTEIIEDIDWNSGAAYTAELDKKPYMLVPTEGYGATVIYDLSGSQPRKVFDTKGWVLRFVRLQ